MNPLTLAEAALAAAEAHNDKSAARACEYIAEQALYGNRSDSDLAYLATTLAIRARHVR